MSRSIQFTSILFCAMLLGSPPGRCALPPGLENHDLVFIYVHGFGEVKKTYAFEAKMAGYLKPLGLKAAAVTFRWNDDKLDLTRVVYQWGEAKRRADAQARELGAALDRLEKTKTRYVLVGYSLGCRVVAGALREGAPLKNLSGVFFLGAALPHDFKLEARRLPPAMRIASYSSAGFDEILKLFFYNAEGTRAAGEVGFDDTARIDNHRTVCTHVHKFGPIQRDYSCLAPAIGALTLAREGIFIKDPPARLNLETEVLSGSVNWNDITRFDAARPVPLLIQQNVNTQLYRAVALEPDGRRVRKAWGANLHAILKKLELFPEPGASAVPFD